MTQKHFLVTGAAGFIGSHLCDRLLEQGHAVTGLDNLVTGDRANLQSALSQPHFSFLERDVCEPLKSGDLPLLSRFGLAGVYHFACPASPVDFDKIPLEIMKVDSLGTMHTVDLALQFKARYLLASTSEVYGDPLEHPQKESYWGNVNPIGPRACYDETKRFAEAYVTHARQKLQLNGGMVRIFNTYGPRTRLNDGRIVPELCRLALLGQPLTLHGDGLQTRSFCFVSDLVRGIMVLFASACHEPVNVGNPTETTVLEFAQRVLKLTGSHSAITYLPARLDDPKRRCPDISRARSLLGWAPEIDLDQGLQQTLTDMRSRMT